MYLPFVILLLLAPQVPPADRLSSHSRSLDQCTASGQQLQPSRLPQISDSEIRYLVNGRPARIRLSGEDVVVEFDNVEGANIYILEIDEHFRISSDIDITMNFVVLDDEIVVRWRETYLHRSYRQGLFRVAGAGIEEICAGTGGGISL
jgi:hypothetical protein